MRRPTIPAWLPIAIAITALLSLISIAKRIQVEGHNRRVDIALEYETIQAYAAASGLPPAEAIAQLKRDGLGGIILSEETIGDLLASGKARVVGLTYRANTDEQFTRMARGLGLRFPALRTRSAFVIPPINLSTLQGVSIGLNPDEAKLARDSGLQIIARLNNPMGVNGGYVRGALAWAHELGAQVFLPMGDQVLGRREAIPDLTDQLRALGMLYASPEFAKMGGDQNVIARAPDLVVRLHSAQTAELDKLSLGEAVDRYSRAARERGMRILLIRPFTQAAKGSPIQALGGFIRAIARDSMNQGMGLGAARPFEDSGVPTWLFLLIGLSLIPSAYFCGSVFIAGREGRRAGLGVVALVGLASAFGHGRPYTALMAAIVFPILAFLWLDSRKRSNLILDFFGVSLISLVGGLAVAGLLNGLPYFIRAEQFAGVKLAVFLPIFVVLVYYLLRQTDLRTLARDPVTWGGAVLGIVILGALLFMSSRTGNDNPAGVSDLELKLRFLLDRILIVRPRTKEFLVGHPLLIVGAGLLAIQRKRPNPRLAIPAALALAGGAIGQTDIVNTMCHIHTPVTLSLLRVGVGAVAGCIIGLVVWAIVRRWLPAGET